MIEPLRQIIVKGGRDLDGAWGDRKTFVREFYFELVNVPIPLFQISPFIPAYNSLHPDYPFAIAKDSKIVNNIETPAGRGITVSTNYEILKPAMPFTGLDDINLAALILGNMPFNLPAQDVEYEIVQVEETLDSLYKEFEIDEIGEINDRIEWRAMPFQTTAGTKLTGTRTRNLLKMSFWYLADPLWYSEAEFETEYTGVVNNSSTTIAGRFCPKGTVKIESLRLTDNTWERAGATSYPMKMVRVVLLIDSKTWQRRYENVSNLFAAYPYAWEHSDKGKANTKMRITAETHQPRYYKPTKTDDIDTPLCLDDVPEPSTVKPPSDMSIKVSPQRIFCTSYDPEPKNVGDSDDPIYESDPQKAIQFFGTREDCFRLNPDSEPTEVPEPMYLDENGFILYPDPSTGKVDVKLSPKIIGYPFKPVDFTPLHFPIK